VLVDDGVVEGDHRRGLVAVEVQVLARACAHQMSSLVVGGAEGEVGVLGEAGAGEQ
jgi:hypothetical protein